MYIPTVMKYISTAQFRRQQIYIIVAHYVTCCLAVIHQIGNAVRQDRD